jgi:hypothetical protein
MKQVHKFLRTYQGLLVSIVMILGVLIGVVVGLIPVGKRILAMREQTSALSKQIDALKIKVNTLEAADEETYKKYLTELAFAVPTDKSLTTVFSTIDGLGTLTGAALSDFRLTKPGTLATDSAKKASAEEKQIGSSLLPFSLTVTGTYGQIREFLDQAIRVRRFFRVRFFSINFTAASSVSVKMGMDAFYAPLPQTLGATSQQIEPLSPTDEQTITKVVELPILSQISETVGSAELLLPENQRADPFAP